MAKHLPKTDLVKEAARLFGAKGGRARAKKLSREELAAIGRKGARARWGKKLCD
jgi:general stress protein YciG